MPETTKGSVCRTKQVIINTCFGGFGLSDEAFEWLIKNRGWKVTQFNKSGRGYKDPKAQIVESNSSFGKYYLVHDREEPEVREDKDIIACIEALGKKANGQFSSLSIVDIPADVNYIIDEYDGSESIHEAHRSWS